MAVLDTLMQRILTGPLPMTFTSPDDVENLRVLREGGWVKVSFSAGARSSATVTELTSLGRVAMQYLQTNEGQK
ncbi:MAG: hypothetical protein KKC79_21270 [Gammaproteobacteria bacterium]|nr:hypothetical protein [Gammaproteobacteria bacterium]MBU1441440.1 hypothetical protein [Gammaproteobacteria bacterium]MBU2288847.1 hypothetical protein [Gammaproteobacteria bacterium]MBU2411170.1 hypothetical protein [Gammaproteobacteria bacterium]